jgi:hypothetical protein
MPVAVRVAVFGLCLLAPLAARAESGAPPAGEEFLRELQDAERLMRESMVKMLNSVDILLQALPRYEAPTVDENGDIIIRRKRPNRSPTLRTGADGGMIQGDEPAAAPEGRIERTWRRPNI